MLNEKITDALSYQMNREIYSGYFYLGMAAYAASVGFKGISNWFNAQFKEELFHADKLFNYISEKGNRAKLGTIEDPPQDFSSAVDLFEKTLAHEKKVTGLIHDLVDLAKKENDKETESFLQWFVKEQQEEEATPAAILGKLKAVENNKEGLLSIDSELAKRK